jgi:L-fuconolactonase
VTHASGFSADPAHLLPVVRHAFDVFGADRIILGSDWPICLLAAPYADVLDTYLQLVDNVMPEARSAIASDNAARIYRLRIPARSG